jgi:toxin ParE1/3/4
MANYRLTVAADEALTRIYRQGVRDYGMEAADGYYYGLIGRFEQIARTPCRYPVANCADGRYRRSVYRAHSIYYRLTADDGSEALIVAVLKREDPESHLDDAE